LKRSGLGKKIPAICLDKRKNKHYLVEKQFDRWSSKSTEAMTELIGLRQISTTPEGEERRLGGHSIPTSKKNAVAE